MPTGEYLHLNKRDKNGQWKGDKVTYAGGHARVRRERGTPSKCEQCNTASAKRYEWASLTKNFSNPEDYIRLCGSCHKRFDKIAPPGDKKGERNGFSKLKDSDLPLIWELLLHSRMTLKRIGQLFGVSYGTIGLIKTRKIWQHLSPNFNSQHECKSCKSIW